MQNQPPITNQPDRRWMEMALALGAFVLVFIVWQFSELNSVLYPLRLLVTFVHETGHGLTAVLTGGRFLHFVVYPNGAGVATTAGGSAFLVPQMGYLGAALFGAVVLYAANRAPRVQIVAGGLGVFFIVCALLYTEAGPAAIIALVLTVGLWLLADRIGDQGVRTARALRVTAFVAMLLMLAILSSNTALVVGLIAGCVFLALAVFGSRSANIFLLNALAMVTGLNVFSDFQFLFGNQEAGVGNTANDALAMANYTHTPTVFWIILWTAIALIMMGAAAYFAFFRTRRPVA